MRLFILPLSTSPFLILPLSLLPMQFLILQFFILLLLRPMQLFKLFLPLLLLLMQLLVKLPGTIEDLRGLIKQCARLFLDHNAEPDTVDLLEELEIIIEITRLVDENVYGRVCQYMIRYVFYSFIFHQTYYCQMCKLAAST
jgi:hypothetical protein